MKSGKRGSIKAKELLKEIGFEDISDLSMDLLVSGLGATLIMEPLKNSDGKIVRGNCKTLIKVNSEIPYEEKKRFTIAHELGHYLLHDKLDLEVHNDNSNTLNWFQSTEKQAKKGIQEWEANDFATELLMPKDLFIQECKGKPFSPQLLQYLSKRFKTSLTSTAYRYMSLDLHPILIVSIHNKIVKYWSKSDNWKVWIGEITKLKPPPLSVATEYIDAKYEYIYSGKEKAQQIDKSTWFELSEYENDSDSLFFEYCIPTKQYKSIKSIIWEE